MIHKRELIKKENISEKHLDFTHVNVRQSISLLLMKLMVFELIAAVGVIVFHTLLFAARNMQQSTTSVIPFNPYIFLVLVLFKLAITAYIILEWHEEYYEISASTVGHYKGYLFKRHEEIKLEHIASVKLEQGLLGRIFNYGTIRLHSWFLGKDYYLYQIHNPRKYEHVLGQLTPLADKMRKVVREHTLEDDE